MITLNDIERTYDFSYPALYKQLEADGMLNVGEYGPEWYKTVYPVLCEQPTLLLHTYDFELLSVSGVQEAIGELRDPDDYREIDPKHVFIPFAQSGAGDHYCFYLTGQEGDDIPIVKLWHDSIEADYLANNLRDFIFSTLLTDMSEQDTYNEVSDEEFRRNLTQVLKTHTRYLPAEQGAVLQQLLTREIADYETILPNGRKETSRGLLSGQEVKDIFPFDKAGISFTYSKTA